MSPPEIGPSGKLASDKDRDAAVEMLTVAVTEGRLTMEEYDQRTTSALTARTFGDIDAVVSDLPDEAPAPAPIMPATSGDDLTAIFGNETRKGHWNVPERFAATAIVGDCHIEMGQARLQGKVTRIDATAILGSVTIFVPDNIDVRLTGLAVLGTKSVKLRRRRWTRPGGPVLEISCRVLLGSVTVKRRG
jgi:hypothetical protein